ncbi:MAG: ATP-binding protein [Alphaproteobacteria bacterium]
MYSKERQNTLEVIGGDEITRIVSTSVTFLERIPSKDRKAVLNRINYPNMRVSVTEEFLSVDSFKNSVTAIIKKSISDKLAGKKDVVVELFLPKDKNVYHYKTDNLRAKILRVSVRLDDEEWFNLMTPFSNYDVSFLSFPYVISILLFSLMLISISIIGVFLATKPLKTFSEAAQKLGHDINAPPVEEKGLKEVKELAHAFNEMQKKLSDLITTRTKFLGAISHDLRTPITRLKIRAEFIEDELQKQKTIKDLDEMEKMISSAITFAKIGVDKEEKTKVNISDFIYDIVEDLKEAGKNVIFAKKDNFFAEIRPLAMKRAVINLIENAVRYGKKATVELVQTNKSFTLDVIDEGTGIPEEEVTKILLPFYRLEDSRSQDTGGIGLGLSVVASVVDIHGGSLKFINIKNGNEIKGLRVSMTIPC